MTTIMRAAVVAVSLAIVAGSQIGCTPSPAATEPVGQLSDAATESSEALAVEPAATQAEPAGDDDVKVGVCYPLGADNGGLGAELRAAVELAVEIVNEEHPDVELPLAATSGLPNLGGARIVLRFGDSQADPDIGRDETVRLIEDEGVVALLGCYHSAVTAAASDVAEAAGVPFLTAESSEADLTERGFDWFFRTTPDDIAFTTAQFDFIEALEADSDDGIQTLALLAEDGPFGSGSAAAQRAQAASRGLDIVADIAYEANTDQLTDEINQLAEADADVVLATGYLHDAILTVETMTELGYAPKLIVAQDAGYTNPEFTASVGADAEGIASRAAFSLDIATTRPVAGQVDAMYEARTGRHLGDVTARAFTGMLTLAEAVNRAKSATPEAIRQALAETDIPGELTIMPWEGIRFDAKGDNELGSAIIVQVQDGEYRTVYPPPYEAVEAIYPMPDRTDRP